ncbi:hypothetical protein MA16_Dca026850 [Dendrobium catenatum]|uniref:Uncharacterized protein n=1 Tax=Dendrobium catenatum TaxID=906689 RepID=A0A2I0VZ24_9ASPA|nr:hypothetical protein MA16_Dca026850 [Dendrobium catenatum]
MFAATMSACEIKALPRFLGRCIPLSWRPSQVDEAESNRRAKAQHQNVSTHRIIIGVRRTDGDEELRQRGDVREY